MDTIANILKSDRVDAALSGRVSKLYWADSVWKVITWKRGRAIENYSGESLELALAKFSELEGGNDDAG